MAMKYYSLNEQHALYNENDKLFSILYIKRYSTLVVFLYAVLALPHIHLSFQKRIDLLH